jgi:hypothetical protein
MSNSRYTIRPMELGGLSTYPLESRKSKVSTALFGRPATAADTVSSFVEKLPRILAADSFRQLVDAVLKARAGGRALLWGMGGHVVKCGLGPILIDMMKDGLVTGIAMNGAAVIHDFEIGLTGSTSEEVENELGSGRFGMARETGEYLNQAVNEGQPLGLGAGESVGAFMANPANRARFEHLDASVLFEAYTRNIPVTVHLAIGTDITHLHPDASGPNLGNASMTDFRLLCAMVRDLQYGVYVNLGSAVILPEVFLKAVSVVRNLGATLDDFTTANMDFIQHYRPSQNGGLAIALTGHHEIMIPLLAAALKGRLPSR